jgi:hypothetical protein
MLPVLPEMSYTHWQVQNVRYGKIRPMLSPKDVITASTPVVASVTLSQVNEIAGLVGTLLGIAYLTWKWIKEIK